MDSHFVDYLSKNRTQLMGAAMVLILLHHMWCFPYPTIFLQVFKFGYFGVDVFIILSGFGLCFSYERSSVLSFYVRRLKRILPLYWLAVLLVICLGFLFHFREYTFTQGISYLTTLSYYGIGGVMSNWFVSAILILYLLFPFFYKLTCKHPYIVFGAINALSLLAFALFDIDWRFECLIARVPSFIFGIICYLTLKRKLRMAIPLYISVLTMIIGFSYHGSTIFYIASFCPVFLFLLSAFPVTEIFRSDKANTFLSFCGKYSYALFTSNIITAWFLDFINDIHPEWIRAYTKVPIYLVLTLILGFVFIKANDWFNKVPGR